MTPSEILTAAADRVRDLAAQATPGQWSAKDMAEEGHPGVWWVDSVHEDDQGTTWSTVADLETVNPAADARWVAALSPEVAPHLEDWLRDAAREADELVADGRDPNPNWAALRVARSILGVGLAGDTP